MHRVVGIGDEVHDHLVKLVGIRPEHRKIIGQLETDLDVVDPQRVGEQLGGFANDLIEQTRCRSSGCSRASAKKFRTIRTHRSAALTIRSRGPRKGPSPRASRSSALYPVTTVSGLLSSCATPARSVPMASAAEKPVKRVKAGLTETITPSESVITIALAAAATAMTWSSSNSFESTLLIIEFS
jgi:hypothetical protein